MSDPIGSTRWGPRPLRVDDIGYTGTFEVGRGGKIGRLTLA